MDSRVTLPPEPLKPEESQCCGQGCQFCILDIYQQELLIWQKKCEELKNCQFEQNNKMSPENYVSCVIERVEKVCSAVFLFHFKLPKNNCIKYTAGQHVIAREFTGDSTICRPYTLISLPGLVTTFSILIKLYDDGMMSNIIRKKWLAGYAVDWRGPIGEYNYQPNSYRNVLLIAAGTGITPVYQIARMIIDNPEDETRVVLLYSCRTYADIIFRDKFHQLQDYWNFKVRYFLSDDLKQEVEAVRRFNEDINHHRLNEDVVNNELKLITHDNLRVYLCGPKSFEKNIIDNLTKIGIAKSSILTFS
ncbi:NADH-cytochrome b5 reductase-like [Daphnia magna]|uniref:NADH-cytochrome b5 reductase-like n=1 Tax=Daphnia magna TaxID=35525 RepID=UPI0006DDD1BF|nr:NADH-cytochrome b5 reductase-like [Daphnia magna]